MQDNAPKVNIKCPECKGSGKLRKLWPLYAISMPNELAWQTKPCWRCKGTGSLQSDDPYVAVTVPVPTAVILLVWFFALGFVAVVVMSIIRSCAS